MSDLIGNPEDRFSRVADHMEPGFIVMSFHSGIKINHLHLWTKNAKIQYLSLGVCTFSPKIQGHSPNFRGPGHYSVRNKQLPTCPHGLKLLGAS